MSESQIRTFTVLLTVLVKNSLTYLQKVPKTFSETLCRESLGIVQGTATFSIVNIEVDLIFFLNNTYFCNCPCD